MYWYDVHEYRYITCVFALLSCILIHKHTHHLFHSLKRSRDCLLYIKKETSRVLFKRLNMVVTLGTRVSCINENTLSEPNVSKTLYIL